MEIHLTAVDDLLVGRLQVTPPPAGRPVGVTCNVGRDLNLPTLLPMTEKAEKNCDPDQDNRCDQNPNQA
jgi:hypothetical protein